MEVKRVFLGWGWPDGTLRPEPPPELDDLIVRVIDEALGLQTVEEQAG